MPQIEAPSGGGSKNSNSASTSCLLYSFAHGDTLLKRPVVPFPVDGITTCKLDPCMFHEDIHPLARFHQLSSPNLRLSLPRGDKINCVNSKHWAVVSLRPAYRLKWV